ncbi:hypothetical protein [Vibrio superstes]|uniref:Uncharacterized protein n=1 Tax=Vibrio superstes NBRC 103154 TaxID=1219062 RepID=A0A511QU67_9VIBR|nr:hypothetical protein [Vibrio superstes]GEM80890.1 hypothetical protein VSU01S_31350 [Vibrio superstes NBRC 103154]
MQAQETQSLMQPILVLLSDAFFYLIVIYAVVIIGGYALVVLKRHLEVIKEQKIMHDRHNDSHHR